MRVLTVRQPWAWAIIHGGKDVENRSRSLGPYRGPVAIHAGLSDADEAPIDLWLARARHNAQAQGTYFGNPRITWSDRGAIIGIVDLVDVHHDNGPGPYDDPRGCCASPWHEDGLWHLVLANPRPIEPIPAKGRLGLWRPDAELLAKIKESA